MAMTKAELKKQLELQHELIQRQQELIEAQHTIIQLQQRIDAMTPKVVADDEIFWHKHSGTASIDAATSNDVAVVKRYQEWLTEFAKTHIKPYVNPKVFGETLNQMTRGLSARIVELELRDKATSGNDTQSGLVSVIQYGLFSDVKNH